MTQRPSSPRAQTILPPKKTSICSVAFERGHGLTFPVLHITGHAAPWEDTRDIPDCLIACGEALALQQPFVTLYDFVHSAVPPLLLGHKLLGHCTKWCDANAREWDTHVQGTAIIIPNPVLRTFVDMCRRLWGPPCPLAFCETREEALEFLRGVRVERSYVKDSYPAR